MASVTAVNEYFKPSGSNQAPFTREYERNFIVRLDGKTLDASQVLNASGIPTAYSLYPTDSGSLVVARDASPLDGTLKVWRVDVSYSTDIELPEEPENPLERPVKRTWKTKKEVRPIYSDIDGNLIRLSNGIPPVPPLQRRASIVVLEFVRNEPSFGGDALEFVDKVNSKPFSGAAVDTLLCDISAREAFENNVEYWIVTYSFEYSRGGWQPSVFNQGYIELDGGSYKKIKDSNGEDVSEPVALDANGAAVNPATLPGSATFTDVDVYERIDFNQLNLPA